MLKITDMDFNEKRVLLRADYNVPVENRKIKDDRRIRASAETIKYILDNRAKQLVIISHLGRPEGNVVENLRLNPIAEKLSQITGKDVKKMDDCTETSIPDDRIVLLENLRFHPEEKQNDGLFARKLAANKDVFVNDAFSVCHREHASVAQIPKLLPSCAGFQLLKEIKNLDISNVKHPAVAVMGGAKVSTKIKLIENLLKNFDIVLIGGAMMFTFLRAIGFETGKSKCEEDNVEIAGKLIENNKKKIVIPIDAMVADRIEEGAATKNVSVEKIGKQDAGVDIGEATARYYRQILNEAKTVLWNGPVGISEIAEFARGTEQIANHIASLDADTIVGGGDTGELVDKLGIAGKFTFVSTAGGAALQYMEGSELPGLKALDESEKKFG